MISSITLVNRSLFVVLAATIGAFATLPHIFDVDAQSEVPPVTVSPVNVPDAPQLTLRLPARNVFDPEGIAWRRQVPVHAVPGEGRPSVPRPEVKGFIRMGRVQGVMTENGFAPVGTDFGDGELKSVGEGRIVLETPSGIEEIVVDPEREQRRMELFSEAP